MAFKHPLGITKGQWLCAEVIRAYVDLKLVDKTYRSNATSTYLKNAIFREYIRAYKRYIDRVYQLVENHYATSDLVLHLTRMTYNTSFATPTDMQDFWIHSHLEDNEEYVRLK